MKLTTSVTSQATNANRPDGLEILRDRSLRTTDPQRVIKAIDEVAAPFLARPSTSKEPIPAEVIAAFVDLLDFEIIGKGNPMFDLSAGRKVYPVMHTLRMMRNPVLPALVRVLETEDTESVKSRNAVEVIRLILGDEKVKEFLEAKAGNAKSEDGKVRILSIATRFVD